MTKKPSYAQRLRSNSRFSAIMVSVVLALVLVVFTLTIRSRNLFIDGRSHLRAINQYILQLQSIEAEDAPVAEDFIAQLADFGQNQLSSPDMDFGRRTKGDVQSQLRRWATWVNDRSFQAMLNAFIGLFVILAMVAGAFIVLVVRTIGNNRSILAFVHGVDQRLTRLYLRISQRAEIDETSEGALIGTAEYEEEHRIDQLFTRIYKEFRLIRDLLERGYSSNSLESLLSETKTLLDPLVPCQRIALAFLDSSGYLIAENAISDHGPLRLTQGYSELIENTSLSQLVDSGEPRIIDDLRQVLADHKSPSTQLIVDEGYLSSLTVPIHFTMRCVGFVFLNADRVGAFNKEHVAHVLQVFSILKNYVYHHYIVQLLLAETSRAFVGAMEKKDDETSAHIVRMSRYSHVIARGIAERYRQGLLGPEYYLNEQMVREILWFAPLHDLGKIGIPDVVLFKTGAFDPPERAIMETHVTMGQKIISTLNDNLSKYLGTTFLDTCTQIIAGHHEHWNGKGYPKGLAGFDIPLPARIVALADVFDALTSARPYKEAWSLDRAFALIKAERGEHFDPVIVDEFFRQESEILKIYHQLSDS